MARELSGLLDRSAWLQIMLPALQPEEPGQGNEQGQAQSQRNEQGHGLALSRLRGLR
ncbi:MULTISPECIES: hypothetical protein [unclassified Prochlorococcus]|uniref:hypothetical protein n=1 Tax=unclassified Prochlorococcus TaxID=2627481 RepID=UPI0039A77F6F